jgi:hypothetical protein
MREMKKAFCAASAVLLMGAAGWSAAALKPQDGITQAVGLLTDHRVNPLGIDRLPPNLSWKVDAAGRTGAAQTAYQIRAAASSEALAAGKTLWDSGVIKSDASAQIAYSGPAPKPGERIWWQVKVWDEKGRESAWSAPAWFEAGLLGEESWRGAQWIGCDRKFDAQQNAPAEYMGPWIDTPDGQPVDSIFRNIELPDKPIVSAMVWWGVSKKVGPSGVVANFDRTLGSKRARLNTIMRKPNTYGFIDLAFILEPGKDNCIELRLAKPASNFAVTIGALIVFADGTEMKFTSADGWQARNAGPDARPVPLEVAESYGGSKYGQAGQFSLTDLAPVWLRGSFNVRKDIKQARLYVCALGQGSAFVNGAPVDDSVLGVPQSDYEIESFYRVHDITGSLKPGRNVLAVLLDAGWYHQVGGFGGNSSYGRPGLKALAKVEYANGETEWFTSGPDWQWKEGAIRSANIYRGEVVDYRRDHEEWKTPDAGKDWNPAQVLPPLTPKTAAMDINPMRRGLKIKPVRSWQIGPETWLVDIGELIHGWVRFSMNEPSGKVVRLRYSEYARDGVMENVPFSHWWCHGVTQGDQVISDGKPHLFEPVFTPKSFRFVEISGMSQLPGDLTAFTVHSEIRPLASFESSDPMLNRLFENGMRTWRNYVNHFIVDIPRERCVWGAESIYSEIPATYCLDMAPNHRLMNQLWLTGPMTKEGIPGNIGVGKRLEDQTGGYIWSVTPLYISSMLFEHYGDLDPARTHYDRLRVLVLEYPLKNSERDGTIPLPYQLADHAAIKDVTVPRDAVKKDLITAMVYFDALNRFAHMADALGKTEDAAKARTHAEKVRATIMSFYDGEKHSFGNGTQNSLALAYGVMTDSTAAEKVAATLAGIYRANGHQFDGGFMSYYIYPMLSRYGYTDDAVKMMVNTEVPGPAWSVKTHDATTFWEAYYADYDWQMHRGLNFMAFAHPIGWMITDLAGIRYEQGVPNGRRIVLAPKVPLNGTPSFIKAALEIPAGTVRSAWTVKDGVLSWEFTVPANVTAEIRIPSEKGSAVAGAESMKLLRIEEDCAVYQAGAGSYSVQSRPGAQKPVIAQASASTAPAIPAVKVAKLVKAAAKPAKTAPPATATGTAKDWVVSKESKATVSEGSLQVSPGTPATVILTTRLPELSGEETLLRWKMKTPASGKGFIRLVCDQNGKKTSRDVEFDLGTPGEWKEYVLTLPPSDGKPVSLWIGLKAKEEAAFSVIRIEKPDGQMLRNWGF